MISFRRPEDSDREILTQWILADPEHSEKGLTPEFFFNPNALAMVIGDMRGPGLYVRLDSEPPSSVRLHIQFSDNEVRSSKTMLRAWPEVKQRIANAGVRRIVFESVSRRLIGFCCRCFGFNRVKDSNDYELLLD